MFFSRAERRDRPRGFQGQAPGGFTLLELITVSFIILLLALMTLPVINGMRARSEKLRCISNLKSLHSATNTYVQENQQWPQIPMTQPDDKNFARNWVKALEKHGPGHLSWICPTIQKEAGAPDLNENANFRIDYLPMPFDKKPNSPYKWPNHPWFVEKGAPHGKGNLIIYSDGRIEELMSVRTIH
jgi:prepilin-type N-terminal cleavage/methylation domain-containing protein